MPGINIRVNLCDNGVKGRPSDLKTGGLSMDFLSSSGFSDPQDRKGTRITFTQLRFLSST